MGKWHAGNSGSGVRKSPLSASLGLPPGVELAMPEGVRPQSHVSLQVCPCLYDNGTIWHWPIYGRTSVKAARYNIVKSSDCFHEFFFYFVLIPDSRLPQTNQKSRKQIQRRLPPGGTHHKSLNHHNSPKCPYFQTVVWMPGALHFFKDMKLFHFKLCACQREMNCFIEFWFDFSLHAIF